MDRNLANAVAAALRLLEHSAAERGASNLTLPVEAEIAVLRFVGTLRNRRAGNDRRGEAPGTSPN